MAFDFAGLFKKIELGIEEGVQAVEAGIVEAEHAVIALEPLVNMGLAIARMFVKSKGAVASLNTAETIATTVIDTAKTNTTPAPFDPMNSKNETGSQL